MSFLSNLPLFLRKTSLNSVRQAHNCTKFINRNPRNLEMMDIGYKPDGYHVDKPGRSFWHKLELTRTENSVSAQIVHYKNGEVIRVSTTEWSLRQYLYKPTDTAAYLNLGRVLAMRCLQCGIQRVFVKDDLLNKKTQKIGEFLKALEEGGVSLKEPVQYKKPLPWYYKPFDKSDYVEKQ